jgi:hypothetical protein
MYFQQIIPHIQKNVAAKFSNKVAADICNISKTFSVYQENKMLDNIKELLELAYDYLVGDNGIEPSKWRSKEWMKDRTLPPRYGIVSTNISESSNSIYEDAHNLSWLHCIDNIMNSISTRIATLREGNRNKTGVVPECARIIDKRWKDCALFEVIQLEEDAFKFKVTRDPKNGYRVTHVLDMTAATCTCEIWQNHGIPCLDAIAYFRK